MIIYIGPSTKELKRFSFDFMKETFLYLGYNRANFIFNLFHLISNKNIFIFNGYRIIDQFLIKFLYNIGMKVIILQHGKNESMKLSSNNFISFIKKFFKKFNIYFVWILQLTLITCFYILKKISYKSKIKTKVRLYYWNKSYRVEYENFFKYNSILFKSISFGTPPMTIWGSDKPIKKITLNAMFIDQPFEIDLNIDSNKVLDKLEDYCRKLGYTHLHVLIHPRSSIKKYKSDFFIPINFLPTTVTNLFYITSTLSKHNFGSKKIIKLITKNNYLDFEDIKPSSIIEESSDEYEKIMKKVFVYSNKL